MVVLVEKEEEEEEKLTTKGRKIRELQSIKSNRKIDRPERQTNKKKNR